MDKNFKHGRTYLLWHISDPLHGFYAEYDEKFNLFKRYDVNHGIQLFSPKDIIAYK